MVVSVVRWLCDDLFFFQAEGGIGDFCVSGGLGVLYKGRVCVCVCVGVCIRVCVCVLVYTSECVDV